MTRENTWLPGVAERLGYYVYLLIDPRDGRVFYVGKGTGERCFQHIVEARKTAADSKADYPKLAAIRSIEAAGMRVRIEVLRHGLDELSALIVEASAIDLLGIAGLENRVKGHGAADLGRIGIDDLNAMHGAKPAEFDPAHKLVLVRVARLFERGIDEEGLYEATRKWWKVGPLRRQSGHERAPTHALAVYRGVVRAVYCIENWEAAGNEIIAADPRNAGRWAFHGKRDADMEERYLFKDVTAELPLGAQAPLRFAGC